MQKKDLIEIGITSVLVIVLIVIVVKGPLGKKKINPVPIEPKQETVNTQSVVNLATGEEASQELFTKLEKNTKDIEIKRDPFSKPPVSSAQESPHLSLELTGILWDPETPKAIINGTILEVGQVIEGNIVSEIKQHKVILKGQGGDFELKLELEK